MQTQIFLTSSYLIYSNIAALSAQIGLISIIVLVALLVLSLKEILKSPIITLASYDDKTYYADFKKYKRKSNLVDLYDCTVDFETKKVVVYDLHRKCLKVDITQATYQTLEKEYKLVKGANLGG